MGNYYIQSDELYHYGISGMKWGRRKAQPVTNSWNGRRHERAAQASLKDAADLRKNGYKKEAAAVQKVAKQHQQKADASRAKFEQQNTPEAKAARMEKAKKVAKVGAAAAGTALAAYGAYKVGKFAKDVSTANTLKAMSRTFGESTSQYHEQVKKRINPKSEAYYDTVLRTAAKTRKYMK